MKMALCFSGQPRTMEYCYPSIKKHLLDVYDLDVFVCSDDQKGRIQELYDPVSMEIYSQDEINRKIGDRLSAYPNCLTSPDKDLSTMWKARRVGEMLHEVEEKRGIYDVVVSTRFDLKILSLSPITLPQPNCIYLPYLDGLLTLPDSEGKHFGGYSSQLVWSSSLVAHRHLEFYDTCDEFYHQLGHWHIEEMTKLMYDANGIGGKLVDMSIMIVRGTNENPLSTDMTPLSTHPEFMV